jgi:ferrous iron transport protein B
MSELAAPARVALVGNPNSGKTALFNADRQPPESHRTIGAVERKEGLAITPGSLPVRLIDLPGTFAASRSLDRS